MSFTCKISIEKRVTKRKDGAQRNLSIKIFFNTIPKSEFVALKLSKKMLQLILHLINLFLLLPNSQN